MIHEVFFYRQLTAKQTGNHEKPVVELYQNAVDAGATEIHITLTSNKCVFQDNGKGMNFEECIDRQRYICKSEKALFHFSIHSINIKNCLKLKTRLDQTVLGNNPPLLSQLLRLLLLFPVLPL